MAASVRAFRLYNDMHRLAGRRALDAVIRCSAQHLLLAGFAALAPLLGWLRNAGLRAAVRDDPWPGAGLVLSYVRPSSRGRNGVVDVLLEVAPRRL